MMKSIGAAGALALAAFAILAGVPASAANAALTEAGTPAIAARSATTPPVQTAFIRLRVISSVSGMPRKP